MDNKVIKDKQDLTYLKWAHVRSSSGTAGSFLKSESEIDGKKKYYKLSNYNPELGIIGHECINEIIVDRLLTLLEVPHLSYELINADIEVDGKIINTFLSASYDYKKPGEAKVPLDDYYRVNADKGENRYAFCERMGWKKDIDAMLAIDYIILNRDRHGANIEVLRNARKHTLRIAPFFDHGTSLLCFCEDDDAAKKFRVMDDKKCNNFIGTDSTLDNLHLIKDRKNVFKGKLCEDDKEILFYDLEGVLSKAFTDKIWKMIFERYKKYENI